MVNQREIIDTIKKVAKRIKPLATPMTTKVGKTHSPFKVLISTVLSPQTRDTVTEPAFERLMKLGNSPQKLLKVNKRKIEKAIYPVSFYRTKARRVKEICKILLEKHDGKVPSTMDQLLSLPGVGRKVGGLVMIYGHNKTVSIPVDTHVHKITNRLGWVDTKQPEKTEQELMRIIPRKYWKEYNNNFVKFGQNICVPVNPHCWECPVSKNCKYYKEVYLPNSKIKKISDQ